MKLSEKISLLRKEKGWSQEQLASKLDVSRQAIYKWEADIATPEIEKLKKLSIIFNISLDNLLNDDLPLSSNSNLQEKTIGQEPVMSEESNNEEKQNSFQNSNPYDMNSKKGNKLPLIIFSILGALVIIAALVVGAVLLFGKHTHEFGDYVISEEETCTSEGSKYRVCEKCDYKEVASIPKSKHNYIILNSVEATCTDEGLSEGKKCSVCEKTIVNQITITKKEHTEEIVAGKEATCLETGLTNGKRCSVCNTVLVEQQIINAKGHTPEIVNGKEATCKEEGLTNGKKCSVCKETLEEQVKIPKSSHKYDDNKDAECNACGYVRDVNCKHINKTILSAVSPSCTKTGLTQGEKCVDCEEIIIKQQIIEKTEHTEETVLGEEPTCEETGLTNGKKCSICDTVLVEQQVISAKGHTEVVVQGQEATCTQTGLTDGKKCSVCGKTTVNQTTILKKDHTEETVLGKEPTCEKTGLTNGKKCSVCNEILLKQQVIIAKGHTEIIVSGKEATCTQTGLTDGKKCSVCGKTTVNQTTILKKDHTEETVTGKEATCLQTGLTNGKKCSVCNAVLVEQQVISAKGHTEKRIKGTDPTCSTTGLTDGIVCSVCDTVIKTQEILTTIDHSYYNNVCTKCNYALKESRGLSFSADSNGSGYAVTGIGSCNDTDLVIPATYNGIPVTAIANAAFINNTTIKSVIIPDNVKTIEMNAFRACSYLHTVDIGNGVEIIEGEAIEAAFYQCRSLKNLKLGNSLKVIPTWGFAECTSLESVVIPDSVEYIGGGAFGGCTKLYNVVIGSGVKICGDAAGNPFIGCEKLLISENGVYYVDKWLVHIDPTVESFALKSNTVGISSYALSSDKLLSVTFNSRLKYVNSYAFYEATSIKSIELPTGVVSIGECAFWRCTSLEKIVIPTTCVEASNIFYAGTEPIKYAEAPAFVFNKIPKEHLETAVINSGTEILPETFKNCSTLQSVIIPNTIKVIGADAFNGCTQISELTIPDSVFTIGSGALKNLSNMQKLVIGKGITTVEKGMLYGASSLEDITIPFVGKASDPDDLSKTESEVLGSGEITFGYIFGSTYYKNSTMIENFCTGVFSGIHNPVSYLPLSLKNVTISTPCLIYDFAFQYVTLDLLTIPKGVEFGGYQVFGTIAMVNYLGTLEDWCSISFATIGSNPCSSGANLYLNGVLLTEVTLNSVNDYVFFGCASITKATVNGDIGICAFDKCTNLTSVTIGKGVKTIYADAFFYCPSLSQVNYLGSIDEWNNIKFATEGSNPTYCGADLYIDGKLTIIQE